MTTTARTPTDLASHTGVHDLVTEDGRVRFDVDSEHIDPVIGYLHRLGIRSLTAHPPTLEQLFLRHYGERLPEQEEEVA